jgi:hypothetical protein
MKKDTKASIIKILHRCIDRAIKRVSVDKTYRPFHEALLTKELVAASAFERSFSTSFGQGPIEEISEILAISTGAESKRQKETRVNVNKGAVDEIDRILSALRSGDSSPNWKKEQAKVLAFTKGDFVQRRVLSDLWIKRGTIESFISIKTVKPNIDQTEIVKKDMLLLKAHDKKCQTFLGLYYNPGGPEREDYNWSVPSKIFDMINDECVLIGQEYWDFVGGKGTYAALLDIFGEVGEETREQLQKLGH